MTQPNILLIVADQQRADCLGFMDGPSVQTPHLDQLAAEGVHFTNAFTHIPICSPSRQSFLNGRRPEAFGGHWNYDQGPLVGALSPNDYAWPRDLASLGYRSAFIGKWHASPHGDPTHFGYDTYVSTEAYVKYRREKHPGVHFTNGFLGEVDPVPLHDAETHVMARWASEAMMRLAKQSGPWHVRLDFSGPHFPCRPVADFAAMYRPEDIAPWDSFSETFRNKPYIQQQQLFSWDIEDFSWADMAPIVARYFAMVSQMDDAIGQVLATLETIGQAENTIVIYTADHGDLCGAHRMLDKHYVLYDDVVRVPLVIRWPKAIARGQCVSQMVYNFLDLPPTLLEWLEIPVSTEFHGCSLTPLIETMEPQNGDASQVRPNVAWRQHVIATYHGQQFGLYSQRMIRTHEWKYVWNATDVDELYHLTEDPAELNNLIGAAEKAAQREPAANRAMESQVLATTLRDLRRRLYDTLVAEGDRQLDNQWVRRQLLEGRKQCAQKRGEVNADVVNE